MRFPNLKRTPPKSNLQRQREFRERNPHYYRDLHRKRKAQTQAFGKLRAAHPELSAGEIHAIVKGTAPAPGMGQTPTPGTQTPLALPASISEPLVTVQLPLFEQAELVEARPQVTPAEVVEQRKRAA